MRPHTLVRHERCQSNYCDVCDGGLSVCAACGAFEGGLTTECPGEVVPYDQTLRVYRGEVDFVGGAWAEGHAAPTARHLKETRKR